MLNTNPRNDGTCGPCVRGENLTDETEKVLKYTHFIRDHHFVSASEEHLAG